MYTEKFETDYVAFMRDGAKWLAENTDIKLVGKFCFPDTLLIFLRLEIKYSLFRLIIISKGIMDIQTAESVHPLSIIISNWSHMFLRVDCHQIIP